MAIWYDSEFQFDRSNVSAQAIEGPKNKRDLPCDTCPLMEKCASDITECSAFRNWALNGTFANHEVGRFIRKAK